MPQDVVSLLSASTSNVAATGLFLSVARPVEIRRLLFLEWETQVAGHTAVPHEFAGLAECCHVQDTLTLFIAKYRETNDVRMINTVLKASDPRLPPLNGTMRFPHIYSLAYSLIREATVLQDHG